MDVLFSEALQFNLPHEIVMRCRVAPSQEEVLRQLMQAVGIELIDYDSFTVQPIMPPKPLALEAWDRVSVYSKAYRERRERETAALRSS